MGHVVYLNKPGYLYVGIYPPLQRCYFSLLSVIWSLCGSSYMTRSSISVPYLYEVMEGVQTLPLSRQESQFLVHAYIPIKLGEFLWKIILATPRNFVRGADIMLLNSIFAVTMYALRVHMSQLQKIKLPPTVHHMRKGSFF